MARRVLANFDAEVKLRLSNRTDVTPTMRGFFVQDGYFGVCNFFDHVELQKIAPAETLGNGTDTLTPAATDIWYPTKLRNMTDGYLIRLESQDVVERAQTKPTAPPYTYYWFGGKFYFESLANGAKTLKVWYKSKPAEFTVSPIIDQIFDPLIIIEAARIGFESVSDFQGEAEQRKRFDEWVIRRNLPIDKAKLNDWRQGFKVKFR